MTIHDVSAYVHTGMRSSKYTNYKYQGFPLGGVQYFLKLLTSNIASYHEVIVCFDSKTDRKEIFGGYKGGRIKDDVTYDIYAQLDFLYEALLRCNIPSYKVDGFEADDLIFTSVEQNKDEYARVTLYSGDYDICHNVDFNVYFEAINKNVNNVSPGNFINAVVRGADVMLNTLSAHKVFLGDGSDRVPPFNSASFTGQQLYNMFCAELRKIQGLTVNATRDPRMISTFLLQISSSFTQEELKELIARIQVVYPRKCEGIVFKGKSQSEMNVQELAKLLTICNDREGLKQLGLKPVEISDEDKESFRRKARELITGEFAVDRGMPVDGSTSGAPAQTVNMREFSL